MSEEKQKQTYTIAYALAPKKVDSVIQPSLLSHAKSNGLNLIPIDPTKPLTELNPPPFDCIIHKLYDDEWKNNLADLADKHPNIPIIDRPEAIERLHNRVSMLQVVDCLKINCEGICFGIPKQVVVNDGGSLRDHGLKFPLIAKPLVANGKDESHNMALVYDEKGTVGLKPPLILQEFVNHGGVIFKVYVAGKHVECVKRRSLPDVSDEKLKTLGGMLPFSQISNLTATPPPKEDNEQQESNNEVVVTQTVIDDTVMPPMAFVYDMANGLREGLGLNLFNFDMIRDASDENRYLVIDINYFPGYAKIPSYETMLTSFLLDVVAKET